MTDVECTVTELRAEVAALTDRVDRVERLLVAVARRTDEEVAWCADMFRRIGRYSVEEADNGDDDMDSVTDVLGELTEPAPTS